MRLRRWLGAIGLAVGVALLAWAFTVVGWSAIWREFQRLGWRMAPLVAFYVVIFGLDTWGWRYAFSERHQPPWPALLLTRMAGEAINYVTPLAWVGGEPVKAYLLKRRHGVPLAEGISSVVIAKTMLVLGLLLFALCGVALALGTGLVSGGLAQLSWTILAGLGCLAGLFIVAQRQGLFQRLGPIVRRLVGSRVATATGVSGSEIDATIHRFYRTERGRLLLSFSFHFLGWVAGVAEIWLILQCLGLPVTLLQAWVIESLWQLLKAGAFLIPGGIGAQEGGILLIFLGLGLSLSSGLTLGLVRRVRDLIWATVGLAVWSRYEYGLTTARVAPG